MSDDNLDSLTDQQLFQVIEDAKTELEQRMTRKRTDSRSVQELLRMASDIETNLNRLRQDMSRLREKVAELEDDGGGDPGGGDPGGGDPGGGPQPAELAFPGAEGFGALARGGRGGRVVQVTNLNDSGPGSFRDAVLQTGPRIVVFQVGGTITLNSTVVVSGANRSFLTIAGQSAPGKGVQFKGFGITFTSGVHDVVVRNIRVRMGGVSTNDFSSSTMSTYATSLSDKIYNVIFDHCSFYWGYDETGRTYNYCENITWQWCIFEGVNHKFPSDTKLHVSKSLLMGAGPPNGARMKNISVHHCFMVNSAQRNPNIVGDGPSHIINNVVYNWQDFGTQMENRGNGAQVNLIGNYYKRGPSTNTRRYAVGIHGPRSQPPGLVYVKDNIGPFRAFNTLDDWDIVGNGFTSGPNGYMTLPAPQNLQRGNPWPDSPVPVSIAPVEQVVDQVLETVGALPRDEVDERAVNDFRRNTGRIRNSTELRPSDWAQLPELKAGADDDRDGMSNLFEQFYGKGALDRNDPSDRNELAPSGYTWIEEYLNLAMAQRGA